ncbi:MAG: hypothetical protein HKN51_10350 [Saprospiraceae bacterium]|nr:hypothetical protein [Saprospiraceae bacterium]
MLEEIYEKLNVAYENLKIEFHSECKKTFVLYDGTKTCKSLHRFEEFVQFYYEKKKHNYISGLAKSENRKEYFLRNIEIIKSKFMDGYHYQELPITTHKKEGEKIESIKKYKHHIERDYLEGLKSVIEKWEKPCFLTLTRVSFKRHELYNGVRDAKEAFEKIYQKCQKRFRRNKGIKLICLVSLECNYNPIKKTYNPHFHIITATKEIAILLNIEWLKQLKKNASYAAQDLQVVKNPLEKLIEVLKYSTKIFTDPDMKKGKYKTSDPVVYAAAIHEIYKAFKGLKLVNSYGFSLPKIEKETKTQIVPKTNTKEWLYQSQLRNYVDIEAGELMYKERQLPSVKVEYLMENNIDIKKN